MVSWPRRLGRSQLSCAAPPHEKLHAADAIIETVEANPGIVIVTLAPLTNVALALAQGPEIASKVGRCVVMGGAPCCEGNVTPAAEYNIWVDPEAARVVFRSGLPIEMVGWQTSRFDSVLNERDIEKIRVQHSPGAICDRVQQPCAQSL